MFYTSIFWIHLDRMPEGFYLKLQVHMQKSGHAVCKTQVCACDKLSAADQHVRWSKLAKGITEGWFTGSICSALEATSTGACIQPGAKYTLPSTTVPAGSSCLVLPW